MSETRLDGMREEYGGSPKAGPEDDPITQFRKWFGEAQDAGLLEPNAMSLATSANGEVTCRTVLLKAFDAQGFVFFTNYNSRKALQIAANPKVALLFPWLPLARQVKIHGKAEKISATESLAYFMSRPFGSRVGTWVSQQSKVIPSREVLMAKFKEMCSRFADGKVPMPEAWGGYRVVPYSMEFWQGCTDRLHDRFLYTRQGNAAWKIVRLAP